MNKNTATKLPRGKRAPKTGARSNSVAFESLTKTEFVVLLWLCEGKRNGEIAIILDRSSRTLEKHVAKVLDKLGVETRGAASRVWLDYHAANGTRPPSPESANGARRNGKGRRS